MKKNSIILGVAILMCVFACSEKNYSSLFTTITISDNGDSILDCNVFTYSIDTLPIKSKGEYFSSVQAACLTDSNLYIIDKTGSIGSFNINTGYLEKKIRKVGHGHDEYINPVSICEDDSSIYILDFQGCSVLTYDLELNFKKRIMLKFPALDFIKVSNGFLFYNMNASDDLLHIVYTDTQGQIINSYLSYKEIGEIMLTDKLFCKGTDEEIYFSDPTTDYLYKWENDSLSPLYYIEIVNGKDRSSSKNTLNGKLNGQHIRSFFVGNQIITLFIQGGIVMANSYEQELGVSHSGIVKTNLQYPFFPVTSYKGALYGLYDTMSNDDDETTMVLVKYNIKK